MNNLQLLRIKLIDTQNYSYNDLRDYFKKFDKLVKKNKKCLKIDIRHNNTNYVNMDYEKLFNIAIALFRNNIVQGLESALVSLNMVNLINYYYKN